MEERSVMVSWRERSLDLGLLWMRVLMGLGIAFLHGYGKVFGGRMEGFSEGVAKMGFPYPISLPGHPLYLSFWAGSL